MENFIAYNPTRLHFGKGIVTGMGQEAAKLGKRALLMTGGGSVKRNGSYDDAVNELESAGIQWVEFNGIRPNPLVSEVMKASMLGKENAVDMVIAVGGGSVIDSAKIVTVCIADDCDAWDVMTRRHEPQKSLPLICILTLAATGTEMNPNAVLQNPETRQKLGYNHPLLHPVHSYLDPGYTLSVPSDHTAYGIADLMVHCLEAWFGHGEASLSDRWVIAIIREAMEYGPQLMENPGDYSLREKIMWAATCALNNSTMHGRSGGDWGVHSLGHVISFLYDTPHGATLTIMSPAWMNMMRKRAGERIIELGNVLFGAATVDETIEGFKSFYRSIGNPVSLKEAGIDPSCRNDILELMNRDKAGGGHHELSDEEREMVLDYAFEG